MDKLLVALDVESAQRALALSDQLRGTVAGFKIGSQLFTAEGPKLVRQMVERGDRIFLDLKYHDIPNTVASAVRAATKLGVWMLTVHASGGRDMLAAAKEASVTTQEGPHIIAVTVLTSFDDAMLTDLGTTKSVPEQVESLAQMSQDAGIDGIVASPLEIRLVRAKCGPEFTIVTPGIRNPQTDTMNDQTRTMDAPSAVKAGADYLVVGRPITAAADPSAAAAQIASQIETP